MASGAALPYAPPVTSGAELERSIRTRLIWAAVLANGLGGVVVFTFLVFLVPVHVEDAVTLGVRNADRGRDPRPARALFGVRWGNRRAEPLRASPARGREPTPEERRRRPAPTADASATVSGTLWAGAAVFFALFNIDQGAVVADGDRGRRSCSAA